MDGGRPRLLCDATGEGAFSPWGLMKGVRSDGRGGGVGGMGVVVRERAGVDADESIVRDSHSLVTACRSGLLNRE